MIDTQVFPYFGGKARVAEEVWRRFGVVDGYVEPFAGSLAMAMRNPRPEALKSENLNDLNGLICNFWRSVAQEPQATASYADWPVSHLDLTARQSWLRERAPRLVERLRDDANFCDPEMAGWWVWGISQWIGSGWCAGSNRQRPHLSRHGMGVHSLGQRPHVSDHGMGVHSLGQRPHVSNHGMGGVYDLYTRIAARLRFARITCCDWKSLRSGLHSGCSRWGVFLDPPYTKESGRDPSLYTPAGGDSGHLSLGHEVAAWALEIGDRHRVALCGIRGEYDIPPTWDVYAWKTRGYNYGGRNREEVIWFSPACERSTQAGLWGAP